jgi:hypothetical protein
MQGVDIQSPEYTEAVSEQLLKAAAPSRVVFETPAPGTMGDVFKEIEALFKPHWDEVALYKNVRPLDVDHAFYEQMSNSRRCHGYLARLDGKIIGYSGYFLSYHPHYKTWLMAKCDVIFIHPAHRNVFVALGLLQHSERELKKLGVKSIVSGTKKHKDLERLFKYLGYEAIETLHEKVL